MVESVTGGRSGIVALLWTPQGGTEIRLAYLSFVDRLYRLSFVEVWNAPAWDYMFPHLDLLPALQRGIDEGRITLRGVVRSPAGEFKSWPISLTGVDLHIDGEEKIKVGTREVSKVLRFEHLGGGDAQ